MAFRIRKVLISDEIDQRCPEILRSHDVQVVTKAKLSKQQLIDELQNNYDALLVRSATKVDADVLAASGTLKLVGRAGTGVDNIDMLAATKLGVVVINTPAGNSISAAELTCYMIMALARKGPQAYLSMKEGKWARKNFMGNELQGKTLAVVGLGRIGREVANRMRAFGMRTIGFDPLVTAEAAAQFDIEWLPLADMFPIADYITVHVPLLPQTKDLINKSTLATCKPTIRIVNCARGGIVNECAVLAALNDAKCGGLGLDVFEEEPPTNRALIEHPLVVTTPHLGASTQEAQTRVAEEIAESIVLINEGKQLRGALNGASVGAMLNDSKARWVLAAQEIAQQALSKSSQPTKTATLHYPKEHSSLSRALTTATLVGLMSSNSSPVNLINADSYAAEAGIKVTATAVDDTILTLTTDCGVVVHGLPTNGGVRLLEPVTNAKLA